MSDEDIVITKENRNEVLAKVFTNAAFEGKVTDWDSFVKHPRVRAKYQELKDPNAVVKAFAFEPPLGDPPLIGEVPGFFVRHTVRTMKDKQTGERKIAGEGPTVLFANPVQVKRPWDGQKTQIYAIECGVNLTGKEQLKTKVVVGPVRLQRNLLTGEVIAKPDKDKTTVKEADHDAPFPEIGIRRYADECMRVDERGERGVVYGDTGNRQVLVVGVVKDESDVVYFPNNTFPDGTPFVKVLISDPEGLKVGNKVPLPDVIADFKLDDEPTPEDIKEALSGEPIAAYGKYGETYPVDVAGIKEDAKRQAVIEAIDALIKSGAFTKNGEAPDGTPLRALDSRHLVYEDENKIKRSKPIDVGHLKAWDVRQSYDKKAKQIKWEVVVRAIEQNGHPWISTRETEFTYTGGQRAGEKGVSNEGGFTLWLNRMGEGVRLRESDPFAGLVDDLGGFEDL